METPTKPALPLKYINEPAMDRDDTVETAGGSTLTDAEVRWLNAAAAAHGPALSALRKAEQKIRALVHAGVYLFGSDAVLSEIRDAIKGMEQAPEPEP